MTEATKNKPTSVASPKKKRPAKAKKTGPAQRKPEGTCFVLMPFKEPFDTYYSAIIEPAILAAKLDPLRGDSLFRPSPIMADVWQMIQHAKVLVAELTEKNANVFYELGLAHALGKPVILISETIDDVPFDLQPLRVILYNKSDPAWGVRLKTNLISSLDETLEDIARAVPPMFLKIVKSQAPEESPIAVRLFDLERRVAALSSIRQEAIAEVPSIREHTVDWERVSRYLKQQNPLQLARPRLTSREEAVAWTLAQMHRYPLRIVRQRLLGAVPPGEAETVFDLALTRKQSQTSGSIRSARPRRPRKQ